MKKEKPHSPDGLKRTWFRVSLYMDNLRKMNLNCIGLGLSLPFFLSLHPMKSLDEEKEKKEYM